MTDPRSEPTPACPVCHRADPAGQSWATCARCVTRVDRQLADLLDLHALAGHALEPTASTGAIGGVPGSRPPLDVAALDVALGEQALGVLEEFETWWRQHWRLAPYGDASASRLIVAHSHGTPELASTPTSRNLTGCIGFLRNFWPRASEPHQCPDPDNHPDPADLDDALRKLHRQTVAALRLHEPRPPTIACPADLDDGLCGHRIALTGSGDLYCRRCGTRWTTARLLLVAAVSGTRVEISVEDAMAHYGCSRATVYRMVNRGQLRKGRYGRVVLGHAQEVAG